METEYIPKKDVLALLRDMRGLARDDVLWDAIMKVKNLPPADVRPVRRGRWKSSCNGWSAFCSVCGEDLPGRVTTPFCPMCGADMGW